jgi:rhomboid family protein
MIPLRDENPSATVPVITRTLIVVNALVFLYEVLLGPALRPFVYEWGLVPLRVALAVRYHQESLLGVGVTVLSSMFLHGGWLHLIGNMWYLHIFGDNVEDVLGHTRFVVFYLACGVVAAALHVFTNVASELPTVGASGAIAGVLGAYMLRFPRARVVTLVPVIFVFQIMALPAWVVLGLWFLLQLLLGIGTLGQTQTGGIALWAHIGGFAFGWVAMLALAGRAPSRAWAE